MKVGYRGGVAATKRRRDRLRRQYVALVSGVQRGAEVVVDLDRLRAVTAGGRSGQADASPVDSSWPSYDRDSAQPRSGSSRTTVVGGSLLSGRTVHESMNLCNPLPMGT